MHTVAKPPRNFKLALLACFILLPTQQANAADSIRIATIERIGRITIAFVAGPTTSTHHYETLRTALDEHDAVLYNENAQTLPIRNESDADILIQSGDLIKGGQQDRMLAYDQIIPPHSTDSTLQAFCVEQGRSTKRGDEPLQTFSSSEFAAPTPVLRQLAMHNLTAQLLHPTIGGLTAPDPTQLQLLQQIQSANSNNPFQPDLAQVAVWNNITQTQSWLTNILHDSVTKNNSPTSLVLALEQAEQSSDLSDRIDDLQDLDIDRPIIGFLYAIDDSILGGDLYASNKLFLQFWPKLSRMIAIQSLGQAGNPTTLQPIDFQRYLDNAAHGPTTDIRPNPKTHIILTESSTTLRFDTYDTRNPTEWIHRAYITK